MAISHSRLASGTALSLFMSCGLFAGIGMAQTVTEEELATAAPTNGDVIVLETVVISAGEQAKQALGSSVVGAEDIARQPVVNDISEIVRKMPGVNLTGSSASGQRGNHRQIDIRGMGPENTLILIDGKPTMSRNAIKMGRNGERDTRGDSNWVPPEMIERIEVLRGPAAARYGSGASGGVVNIITKRPDTFTGQVGVHLNLPQDNAEASTARTNFMLAGPANEQLSFRVFGNYNETDPDSDDINQTPVYDDDGNPALDDDGNPIYTNLAGREGLINKDLGAMLTWHAAPGHEIDFEANFSRQGNIYAGDTQLGSRNEFSDSFIGNETNRMYRRNYAVTHRGEYDFGESQSYLQYEHTTNSRLCESGTGSGEGRISPCIDTDGDGVNDAADFRTITLRNIMAKTEWSLPISLGTKNSNLTFGAEYRGEFMEDPVSILTDLPPDIIVDDTENDASERATKLKQNAIGIYTESNIEWNDQLTLTPGLRFDHNSNFGSNLSPSLNADYRFNDEWTMKLGIARAFKAPSMFQLNPNYVYVTMGNGCPYVDGVRLGGPCYVIGNPDLDAEISVNKEIGVAYEGVNGINASLTYFHNDYKNKIHAGQLQYNPDATTNRLFRWENTGPAIIEGIEGNFSTALNEEVNFNANFTYMIDSKIRSTGQPLIRRKAALRSVPMQISRCGIRF